MDSSQSTIEALSTVREPINRLTQHVRRLGLASAVSDVLIAAWLVAAGLILIDFAWRPDATFLRLLSTCVWLSIVAWFGWKRLLPLATHRHVRVAVVRSLCQYFPSLSDYLPAALAFEAERPPGSVRRAVDDLSPQLRARVVSQACQMLAEIDAHEIVLPHRARFSAIVLGVLVAGSLVLLGAAPEFVQIGAFRLLHPLAESSWPQRNRLQWAAVPRYTSPQTTVELRVRSSSGPLPSLVWLEVATSDPSHSPDSAPAIERVPMANEGHQAVAQLEVGTQQLWCRAVGGDDHQMPWHTISVVEPPEVVDAWITLNWPAYTGWPRSRIAFDHLHALEGTLAWIDGKFADPVHHGELNYLAQGSPRPGTARGAPPVPLVLDGRSFRSPDDRPMTLETPGRFQLQVTMPDQRLTVVARSLTVSIHSDQAPTARWLGRAPEMATPTAALPLRVQVDEDVGMSAYQIQTVPASETAVQWHPIVSSAFQSPPSPLLNAGWPASWPGRSIDVEADFQLTPRQPEVGTMLTYRVEVRDSAGHIAATPDRTLRIVSLAELESSLNEELEQIARVAEQIADAASSAPVYLASLQSQSVSRVDVGSWTETVDQLTAATMSVPDGLLARLADFQRAVNWNHIDQRPEFQELAKLHREFTQTYTAHLAALDEALRMAQASFDERVGAIDEAAVNARSAVDAHQQLAACLAEFAQRLQGQRNSAYLVTQLSRIRADQQTIGDQIDITQDDLVGLPWQSLTTAQRDQLAQLAAEQSDLVRTLGSWQAAIDRLAGDRGSSGPAASEAVQRTSDAARRLRPREMMLRLADEIRANRLGQAFTVQEALIRSLDELLRQLGADVPSARPADATTGDHSAGGPAALVDAQLLAAIRQLVDDQLALAKLVRDDLGVASGDRPSALARPVLPSELAARQRRLLDRVLALEFHSAERRPWDWVVSEIERTMKAAADACDRGQPVAVVISHQELAAELLKMLIDAASARPPIENPPDAAPLPNSELATPDKAGERLESAEFDAEIRVMIQLQRRLQVDADRFMKQFATMTASQRQAAEYQLLCQSLADRQGRLAELLSSIVEAPDVKTNMQTPETSGERSDQELDSELFAPRKDNASHESGQNPGR